MKKIVSIVLVLVLLAAFVPLAITPAAAYEKKIPFAGEDSELTKDELVNAILSYMLDEEGAHTLDDVGDAAYAYAHWSGKPRTFKDSYDRTVTFYRPIERLAAASPNTVKTIIAVGACDKLVTTSRDTKRCVCYTWETEAPLCERICGGRLFELPEEGIGPMSFENLEFVVYLKPDLIFDSSRSADTTEEKTGIPTVAIMSSGHDLDTLYKEIETMGVLLEKEQEAEELTSFIQEKIDKVREVTSQIPEHERQRVYFATRGVDPSSYIGQLTRTTKVYYPLDVAGGINVARNMTEHGACLKEQIIAWNPDIIIVACGRPNMDQLERVITDPDLQTINAVKDHKVYYTIYPYCYGTPQDRNLIVTMYLAKLFYPDKFEDLDVEEEGNEVMNAFLGVDGLFTGFADYTVWMREYLDE